MERRELGTMLPFACGVSNGGSCQKPTFNVRPTGIWERQKLGRKVTDGFRAKNVEIRRSITESKFASSEVASR